MTNGSGEARAGDAAPGIGYTGRQDIPEATPERLAAAGLADVTFGQDADEWHAGRGPYLADLSAAEIREAAAVARCRSRTHAPTSVLVVTGTLAVITLRAHHVQAHGSAQIWAPCPHCDVGQRDADGQLRKGTLISTTKVLGLVVAGRSKPSYKSGDRLSLELSRVMAM